MSVSSQEDARFSFSVLGAVLNAAQPKAMLCMDIAGCLL